jgi:hypothetical protein
MPEPVELETGVVAKIFSCATAFRASSDVIDGSCGFFSLGYRSMTLIYSPNQRT